MEQVMLLYKTEASIIISVSDPVGFVSFGRSGSGSTSGNVDLDPGTKKKIVINSHTNQPKL